MRCFRLVAVLTSVIGHAIGAAVSHPGEVKADYDAIIVGGGPSGLSALSGLARVRRNVLLIDSGVYRNGPTRHMHDVLGFDGVTPDYYRWAAREQLSHYDTVKMVNGTVTDIQPNKDNSLFSVSATFVQGAHRTVTARKVILGTGLRDILPDTPGIQEIWGNGIFWCPWCDGHEHADQELGLLAPIEEAAGMVREILTLNKDIIAFVNGTDTPEGRAAAEKAFPQWETYLDLHNVTVENRTITEIKRLRNGTTGNEDPSLPSVPEHDLFRVDFTKGPSRQRAAFFASFPDEQQSSIGADAGVHLLGGRLEVDPSNGLVTNVPGIYAIGDANSDNTTNVPHALFTGKRTAVFVHVRLEREDAAVELADAGAGGGSASKRGLHERARNVWDEMNGQKGELLYAGEFEQ